MVDTLGDMQDAVSGRIDSTEGQFKDLQGWLVGSSLLGGDDVVEVSAKLGACLGKEIVVYVGQYGEPKSRFEAVEGGNGVGPWLPSRQGSGQGC